MSDLKTLRAVHQSGHTFEIQFQLQGGSLQTQHFSFDVDTNGEVPLFRAGGDDDDEHWLALNVRKTVAPPPYSSINDSGNNPTNHPVSLATLQLSHHQGDSYDMELEFTSEDPFRVVSGEVQTLAFGDPSHPVTALVITYADDADGDHTFSKGQVNCNPGTTNTGLPILLTKTEITEPFNGIKHGIVWVNNA